MDDDRLTGNCRPNRSNVEPGCSKASANSLPIARLSTLSVLCLSASSCSGVQSALDPAGREASDVATLFFTMLVGGAIIWAGVVALLFYASRKRHVYSEKGAGKLILWGGVVFPVITLGALLSYAVWLMPNVRPWFQDEDHGMRRIEVTGEQFWWRVRYPEEGAEAAFETANEVKIPVGERVLFLLNSPDVIHSFWIPVLGGKMDMIPGRQNRLTLHAEKPGIYRGVCAEFCGTSHALMAFTVEAMEPDAYQAWLASRRSASGAQDAEGLALFLKHGCSACHAISGTQAQGTIGPNLTAYGSRGSVAAGSLENTQENIVRFIRQPDAVKPGVFMPHYSMLPEGEINRIAAYLKGLR
jgi:cytochrome c oxidase subunit 2